MSACGGRDQYFSPPVRLLERTSGKEIASVRVTNSHGTKTWGSGCGHRAGAGGRCRNQDSLRAEGRLKSRDPNDKLSNDVCSDQLRKYHMKLQATYVSADEFDDQYSQISFDTEDPDADLDLSAPLKPYLLIQRQFEDDDGGVPVYRDP
jgi:hypothetical protein